jgi:hypothetical protein
VVARVRIPLGASTAEDPAALRATMMIFGGFAFRFGRWPPSAAKPRSAADVLFACPGRLAQLGERLPYKQEVGGSIPSPPTRTSSLRAAATEALIGDASLPIPASPTLEKGIS